MKKVLQRLAKFPLTFLFLMGLAIHLWNIGVDLPNNYYTDEPHHLNKAAAFGSGNLNPHDFKYPTLWSYMLAVMLGGLYAAGSLLGLVASSVDFAQKYLYNPGFFFFCGRVLSSLFIVLVPLVFYRIGVRFYSKPFAWAAALLAMLSSGLAEFSLQAVPYSMLVFFAALSLFPLHAIFEGQGTRAFAALGFIIGLTISSHYVAASYGALMVVAFLRGRPFAESARDFFAGAGMVVVGFFLGTPFLLPELKNTAGTIGSFLVGLPFLSAHPSDGSVVLSNINGEKLRFIFGYLRQSMDLWGAGLFLVVLGYYAELRARRWRPLLFLLPYATVFPVMLVSFFSAHRYAILLTVPLFLPAARGALFLTNSCGGVAWKRRAVMTAIGTIFAASYFLNRLHITVPDTRTMAQHWIEQVVPAGEKVLTAGPYEGPQLMMAKSQVERLHERTRSLRHPREIYYRTLLSGHPGGGYEILYVKKTVEEILDIPSRTEKAFQAQEFIDVIKEGVAPLLQHGVRTVVILKNWENVERHKRWIAELRSTYRLAATFEPEKNKVKGYHLEIYRK